MKKARCPICGEPHIELKDKGLYKGEILHFECDVCTASLGWDGDRWVVASITIPAAGYFGAQAAAQAIAESPIEFVDVCDACGEQESKTKKEGKNLCYKCYGQMALGEIRDNISE